jgi:hypothetical protein
MSIIKMIERNCKQDLVYWALQSLDGYSRETFASPVAIKGRWEGVQEIVKNSKGEEVVSIARVWVLQDVTEGGYLYLGTTTDADYNADPRQMDDDKALRVIAFTKLPRLGSTTEFLRKAHLNIGRSATV